MGFLYRGPARGSPPTATGRMMARADEQRPMPDSSDRQHCHRDDGGAAAGEALPRRGPGEPYGLRPYVVTLGAVAAASGVAGSLQPVAGLENVDLVFLTGDHRRRSPLRPAAFARRLHGERAGLQLLLHPALPHLRHRRPGERRQVVPLPARRADHQQARRPRRRRGAGGATPCRGHGSALRLQPRGRRHRRPRRPPRDHRGPDRVGAGIAGGGSPARRGGAPSAARELAAGGPAGRARHRRQPACLGAATARRMERRRPARCRTPVPALEDEPRRSRRRRGVARPVRRGAHPRGTAAPRSAPRPGRRRATSASAWGRRGTRRAWRSRRSGCVPRCWRRSRTTSRPRSPPSLAQ